MARAKAKPSFDWGAYKGGGAYLTPEEKAVLIDNEVVFEVTGVREDEENKFGPRYVVTAVIPNALTGEDEERFIGFPIGSGVVSRDKQLEGMLGYFEEGGDALASKLVKGGQAILLAPAEED